MNMRDAFDVLDIPPSFEIDLSDLARRQRQLLTELHPQRHLGSPVANDDADVPYARQGEINEACRQLRDPIARAEMLLRRHNQPVISQGSSPLLARIFAEREVLEHAISERDRSTISDCVGAALSRQVALFHELTARFRAAAAKKWHRPATLPRS